MEDLTGKQFGSYRIVAPLGEGGMASVYKAYQPGIDRYVALKILPRHFANDPQFIKRFEQEAKVSAKLQHPHIVPIHDYGQAEGYTYIVMSFIESGDLTDILMSQQPSLSEIVRIVSQVGDALDYAHSMGIVHRDIKPSNILVDKRGNCLLTDFGIAKMVEGVASEKLTTTGHVVGTPTYMSPEQGYGKEMDGRSDIYALGVILYEMITGRVPFRAETPMAVVIKHMNDPLPPPHEFNPDLPEAIERVALKALAKNPKDRYATAGDMVKALETAMATIPPAQAAEIVPANFEATSVSKLRKISPAADRRPTAAPEPSGQTAKITEQPSSNQSMLWIAAAVFLAIIVIGLIGFGVWFFTSNGSAVQLEIESGNDAGDSTTDQPLLLPTAAPTEIPTPTQAPLVTPTEEPTSTPAPVRQEQPSNQQPPANQTSDQPPQPGDGPAPPPEALNACTGASQGATCEFTTPRGTITGTCQLTPDQQLACVPPGGPPPRTP